MGFAVQEITDLACEKFCFREKPKEYFRRERKYLDFVMETRSACKFELLNFLLKC